MILKLVAIWLLVNALVVVLVIPVNPPAQKRVRKKNDNAS